MDMKVIGQGGQTNLNRNDTIQNVQELEMTNKDVENQVDSHLKNGKSSNEVDRKELEKAVKKLNTFLEDENTHAEISIHDKLKTIMVKILDEHDNVIMEAPPKKILDMVAKMCELAGVLVDKKA